MTFTKSNIQDRLKSERSGRPRSSSENLETLSRILKKLAASVEKIADGTPELNLKKMEELYIELALKRSSGNRTKAAALLGIGRSTLINKLKKNDPHLKGMAGRDRKKKH